MIISETAAFDDMIEFQLYNFTDSFDSYDYSSDSIGLASREELTEFYPEYSTLYSVLYRVYTGYDTILIGIDPVLQSWLIDNRIKYHVFWQDSDSPCAHMLGVEKAIAPMLKMKFKLINE